MDQALTDEQRSGPKRQAQELAYQSMEAATRSRALDLAEQALALDPDCVDALRQMADLTSRSRLDLIEALRKAVEAGERTLGAAFVDKTLDFWGDVRTRPYMRAKMDLADALWRDEQATEAIAHYEALLEMKPDDNQGVRDVLLACYLEQGKAPAARALLDKFEGDDRAVPFWGAVLERLLSGDLASASAALRKAREENPYVEPYLLGRKRLPDSQPDHYKPGNDSEAVICADLLMKPWRRHPEAVRWLTAR